MKFGLVVGFVASLAASSSYGLRLPLTSRDSAPPHSTSVNVTALGQKAANPFAFVKRSSTYAVTVDIQGESFTVVVDTGSSDLWVQATVNDVTYTGANASLIYGDGSQSDGPIVLADVTFGNFTIKDQSVLLAPDAQFSATGEAQGILGVGAKFQSEIYNALNGTKYDGRTLLDHIFALYPDEPNYITFLLTRSDVGETTGGIFSIGEVVPEVSNVLSTPKLPVVLRYSDILHINLPGIDQELGAWLTLMDAMEVNGVRYTGNSPLLLNNLTTDQTLILLDTGTTFGTAPPYYVDALYKNVPGAVFDKDTLSYIIPCNTKINASMVFGNISYPLHPIDLLYISGIDNTTGTIQCSGSFQYSSLADGVDFILGGAFLRNVYSLYEFGNWTSEKNDPPYMQILGITDPDSAWTEFDTMYKARFENYLNSALHDGDGNIVTSTVTITAVPSASVPVVAQDVVTTTVYSTVTPIALSTQTSSARPSANVEDFAVAGALADSTLTSSPDPSSSDTSAILRNSYILIALAGAAVLILIVLLCVTLFGNRNKREYAPVRETFHAPVATDKPYSAEASYSDKYSNPYSD